MSENGTTLPPVRVDKAFKRRLAAYAESQERDVSWVVRKAISAYLDQHGKGLHGEDPHRKV
ncbi:CopG family ribbon-helix-helix protein [Actinomadura nitritigenes]|uniref:CopG family ribbon-helix-helix protein n=1 Tax=Actinomadura nitritigenes TaxID=134602 RepID=UPI003D919C4C